jgi:N-acetylneuraminic acid mutarotase
MKLFFTNKCHYSSLSLSSIVIALSMCIAACGGGGGDTATSQAPTTAIWSTKTANHGLGILQDQTLVAMTNGDLYVVASKPVGNNYQPLLAKSTDGGINWVLKTALPFTSLFRFAAVSNGTHIVVTGGRTSNTTVASSAYTYNEDVYRYDPSSDKWTVIAVKPFTSSSSIAAREGHAMAFNGVSSIFVTAGGAYGNGLSYKVFESQDAGVTWTQKGTPPYATHYNQENHCLVASGSTLYSLGGSGNPTTDTNYIGNLTYTLRSTDSGATWTVMSKVMPDTAKFAGCALVGGTIYSTGGLNDLNQTSNITRKSSNGGLNWTIDLDSAILGPRFNHSMTARNGKLVIFGGRTAGTPSEKYDVIESAVY